MSPAIRATARPPDVCLGAAASRRDAVSADRIAGPWFEPSHEDGGAFGVRHPMKIREG